MESGAGERGGHKPAATRQGGASAAYRCAGGSGATGHKAVADNDPPPHLAAAVRAAAEARALAARIRGQAVDPDQEHATRCPPDAEDASQASARPALSDEPERGAEPDRYPSPQEGSGKRFARTAAAARRALEEDGATTSWHLNRAVLDEERPPWRRLIRWARLPGWRWRRSRSEVVEARSECRAPTEEPIEIISFYRARAAGRQDMVFEPCRPLIAWTDHAPAASAEPAPSRRQSGIRSPTPLYAQETGSTAPAFDATWTEESCAPLPSSRALVPVSFPARLVPAWPGIGRRQLQPFFLAASRSLATILVERDPVRPEHGGDGHLPSVRLEKRLPALVVLNRADSGKRTRIRRGSGISHGLIHGFALTTAMVIGALCSVLFATTYPGLVYRISPLGSPAVGSLEVSNTEAPRPPASGGTGPAAVGVTHPGEMLARSEDERVERPDAAPAASGHAAVLPAVGLIADAPAAADEESSGDPPAGEARPSPAPSGQPTDAAPSDPWDVLYQRAHEMRRQGDLKTALDLFREAAELNPDHPAVLYDWGYVLQLEGERAAAIEKYRQAIVLDPHHHYAYYNLGYLLQQQGDEAGAIENYEKSNEIKPDNPFLHFNWGSILERRGDVRSAAEHYRRAAALAPDSHAGQLAQRRLAQFGMDR